MGSEFRSCASVPNAAWFRLWDAVGGVFDSGGDIKVGVVTSASACAVAGAVVASAISSRAMVRMCGVFWISTSKSRGLDEGYIYDEAAKDEVKVLLAVREAVRGW